MINTEIININAQISSLKEEFTNEQNKVNYYYWPYDAKYRKKRKDYIWLFAISVCIVISVVLAFICNILKNEYLTATVLGLAILLFGFTGYMGLYYNKKLKALTAEWNKALVPVEELKTKLDANMEKATEMMIAFLTKNYDMTQEDVIRESGNSYDEIYVYYDQKVNN